MAGGAFPLCSAAKCRRRARQGTVVFCRIVVSRGTVYRPSAMPSYPATAMSCGTRRPWSCMARMAPTAIRSDMAKIAVRPGQWASRCSAAAHSRPASRSPQAGTAGQSRTARRAAAGHPDSRPAAAGSGGRVSGLSPMMPMTRWPLAYNCSIITAAAARSSTLTLDRFSMPSPAALFVSSRQGCPATPAPG